MNEVRKIECVAVDDEPFALEIIQNFCLRVPSVILRSFNNSLEAYRYLEDNTPDILFLDIVMPDISGIEIARLIKKVPYIIFTTAHKEYALESYEYNTVDYLLKPFDFERFYKALEKAKSLLFNVVSEESESITVIVDYHKTKILLSEIRYIESMGNYVKIYAGDKCHMPQLNIKAMMEILEGKGFERIHKSYIINKNSILSYTKTQVMIGDAVLPIGRAYGLTI